MHKEVKCIHQVKLKSFKEEAICILSKCNITIKVIKLNDSTATKVKYPLIPFRLQHLSTSYLLTIPSLEDC